VRRASSKDASHAHSCCASTALTISAVNSAAKTPAKSRISSETIRPARRSVSMRSTNESAGGRLRRTSTVGSVTVVVVDGARGGISVGASAKALSLTVNARDRLV
jgi:hypothetical protein